MKDCLGFSGGSKGFLRILEGSVGFFWGISKGFLRILWISKGSSMDLEGFFGIQNELKHFESLENMRTWRNSPGLKVNHHGWKETFEWDRDPCKHPKNPKGSPKMDQLITIDGPIGFDGFQCHFWNAATSTNKETTTKNPSKFPEINERIPPDPWNGLRISKKSWKIHRAAWNEMEILRDPSKTLLKKGLKIH